MARPGSSPIGGGLLALAAFGIFATHDALVKFLGGIYSPVQIVFFSTLFAFPLVTLVHMRERMSGNLRPRFPLWTGVRTVSTVFTGLAAFYAFSNLPLAQTYAILFATPLVITILSVPILGERVRLRRALAVLVGFAGVMIVLRPGSVPLSLGHLAALGASVGSALGAIAVRKVGAEERHMVLMLYPMAANFAVTGAMLPFVYHPMPGLHLTAVATIAVLSATATFLIIRAYQQSEAVIVAPMQYSQILWATVYGLAFFSESPDRWTVAGAALIIASGVYILWRESLPATSRTRPVLRGFHLRQDTGTMPRIGLLLGWRKER